MWSALLAAHALAAPWPDLSVPAPGSGGGKDDAAVVVGIEDYAFVADVEGATANAIDWQSWLVTARGVPPDRVHRLLDAEATDLAIREALERASGEVGAGGRLWFVFVGHGAPSKDGRDGLLVGADAQQSAVGIASRSVPRSELLASLMGGGREAVAILDACFSGRDPSGETLVANLQPVVPVFATAGEAVTLLTAARSDQFAGPLPGGGRPAFSYLVLGALRGWGDADGDGTITAAEAHEYASRALAATVRDRTQTPERSGPDLALSRGDERGPDLAALVLGQTDAHDEGLDLVAERARLGREARDAHALAIAAVHEEAAEAVRAEAAADWRRLSLVLDLEDPDVVRAVEAFHARYSGASVEIEGVRRPVDVPERALAREWLNAKALTAGASELRTERLSLARVEPGELEIAGTRVRLTRPFLVARAPIPESLFAEVAGIDARARGCTIAPDEPAICLSWFEAVAFCNQLSRLEGLTPVYAIDGTDIRWDRDADGYRLPTEAELDHARRSAGLDAPVAEWAWDRFQEKPSQIIDPSGPSTGWYRTGLAEGERFPREPDRRPYMGFRVVREVAR